MHIFNSISTATLIWLSPIIFMLHDFEEIIFMVPWLDNNYDYVKTKTPDILQPKLKKLKNMTTEQFALAVVIEFVIFSIGAFLAVEYEFYYPIIVLNIFLLLHGLGHIISVVKLKKYAPCIITTILLVLPYSLYLIYRVIKYNSLEPQSIILTGGIGVLILFPILALNHKIAEIVYEKLFQLVISGRGKQFEN